MCSNRKITQSGQNDGAAGRHGHSSGLSAVPAVVRPVKAVVRPVNVFEDTDGGTTRQGDQRANEAESGFWT
jgi:hypothetical protein